LKICADVGGSFVDIAVVAGDAAILHRRKLATPTDDWAAFVRLFGDIQAEYTTELGAVDPISIAVAGLVAPDTGAITSANIDCIHDRPLAQDLSAALQRPVFVINDADAFALAEAKMGVAQGHRRVFGVILGTGVGGGLIEDGRVVTGARGIGGEWGHGQVMVPSRKAPDAVPVFECGCGRIGCLDTIGGARGLERLHGFLHGIDVASHEITRGWENGVSDASATIDYYCDLLAGPLAMMLNTFPATIVPIGGGLSNSTALLTELDCRVRRGMLSAPAHPILVPTVLGGNAGLLGAAFAAEQ